MRNFYDQVSAEALEDFRKYHKANPWVWDQFKRFATVIKEKGFKKYSAKSIFERIRWEFDINRKEGADFKLNNNYTSLYARLLMSKMPEFEGFFELRELQK